MDIHDQITDMVRALEAENERLLEEIVLLEADVEYWRAEAYYWEGRAVDAEEALP